MRILRNIFVQNYIGFPKVLVHQDNLAHIFHFGGCNKPDGSPLDFSLKRLKQFKKISYPFTIHRMLPNMFSDGLNHLKYQGVSVLGHPQIL